MLTVKMKLIKVDYEKLAERFIPDAFTSDTEPDNLAKKLASKLFVKDGEASSFTKGILRLIPNQTMNSLAYNLVIRNQDRFREVMNQAMEKSLWEIEVANLRFLDTERAEYDMLKLEIVLKEIDYTAVVSQLMPKLLEGMSMQEGKAGQLGQLFLSMGGTPNKMLAAAFDILSQKEKDELLLEIVNIYREDIIQNLNQMAEQQKIAAEVAEIKLSRVME